METIFLTRQDGGNGKKRFGVSLWDSLNIFKNRYVKVEIYIDETNKFPTQTTCGIPFENGKPEELNKNGVPFNKKGYDLYSKEISNWIIKNEYKFSIRSKSKILEFYIYEKENIFYLKLK